jgi:hypothetical protein
MPKAKTEEVKLEDVKADEKIAVEMTKKEAEEFAELKEKKSEEQEFYQLTLAYKHNINGNSYGPGAATIPGHLLGHIQSGEQKQLVNELKLNQSAKHFFDVTSGRAVKVNSLPGF